MKFWGRKLEGVLAGSLVLALGAPVFGQSATAQSFTPAVGSTYLDGYAPLSLPRAQATESGTVYSAPPVAGQVAPQTSQTSAQVSDSGQEVTMDGVLQTAFVPKNQDGQQNLPTVVQQFAKSYEAPMPVVQSAKPGETTVNFSPATAQPVARTACETTAPAVPQAVAPIQPTVPCAQDAAPCAQKACDCACCADPFDHRCGFFGEYLFLRAFDVDMAHGIQANSTGGLGTVPAGDVGTVQPQFQSGFRVGADWACNCCSDLRVTYTWYQSHSSDLLFAQTGIGGTATSLVLDPGTVDAAATFDSLFASYQINFQTVDIDYTFTLDRTDYSAWNLSVGTRYAHLEQDFHQVGEFTGAGGRMDTGTSILFDGVGLRTGIEGTRECGKSRVFLYGKCFLDVLFGDFRSNYNQVNVTTSEREAFSHWVDGRVMPTLETEVGLRWVSCDDHCKFGVGYNTAYWFNAVDTAQFIQAVQADSFTHVGHAIVFTGLVAHAEYDF